MIPLYILYTLWCIPLSYAYYQAAEDNFNITIGPDPTIFRVGNDVYTITSNISGVDFVSKFGINVDQNNSFYGESNTTAAMYGCIFCNAFTLSETSVVISTGYDYTLINNYTNVAMRYYNPQTNKMTVLRRDFVGSPSRRILHQEVISPDNTSIYSFGGVLTDFNLTQGTGIFQFDLTVPANNASYINHGPTPCLEQYCAGDFTFVGGTATMLPNGVVVLAFGSKDLNFFFHDTNAVYLYNTNTNNMTLQNVSGTMPEPRVLSTGVLGPDNECIYYFGGASLDIYYIVNNDTSFDVDRSRAKVVPGMVVLNTSSWTWMYPNVTGPPNVDRFSAFSMLYVNNSIMIGGGTTPFGNRNDISILRNLPLAGQSFDDVTPQWFTNSAFDEDYGSGVQNDEAQKLSTGAIVGIAIGIILFIIIVLVILWRVSSTVRSILYTAHHKMFWDPRPGEPFWAEFVRVVTRIILFCIFIAFFVYIILRALSSPIINQVETKPVEDIELPDIRICSKSLPTKSSNAINIICGLSNGTDCSSLFQSFAWDSEYLSFDGGNTYSYCVYFFAPAGLTFHDDSKSSKYMSSNSMTIKANQVYNTPTDFPFSSFYITYYAPGYNPNRIDRNISAEGTKLTEEDVKKWKKSEESYMLGNTFSADLFSYTTIGYSYTQSSKLTNSSWNNIGFFYQYDTALDVTQDIGPSVQAFNASTDFKSILFEIIVLPSQYQINITKEQKVSTIIGGLAQAGGVLSLIIAVQVLLFGFRPNSPWGLIHRWSFGSSRRSLSNKLATQFEAPKTAIPFITPVHNKFSDVYEEISQINSESAFFIPKQKEKGSNDSFDNERLKLVEERLQLMELLFKSYYINDEIFSELDKARRKKERESDSLQSDENIPLSQGVRRRTNAGDNV
ncbi:hypothetical protein K501DRAFT_286275 [Backusella circina FSU 941]|nr:hypothetical protein K501DRAFT_286275 [Backusella circina FSU 941]